MKFILLVCILASASAQSRFERPQGPWKTLRSENVNQGNGNFYYDYLTENGIQEHRLGTRGRQGQTNMEGSYSFTYPDGRTAIVNWVADQNGYRPEAPVYVSRRNTPTYNAARLRYDSLIRKYKARSNQFRNQLRNRG